MSLVLPAAADLNPTPPPRSDRGEWTWELVTMFPRQGDWTEDDYLRCEFNGLVEFVDGVLEFLPTPTFSHQDLVAYLYTQLSRFIGPRKPAEVYFSPIHVKTIEGSIREPDVAYIRPQRIRDRSKPAKGADLVLEVVSGAARDRDRDDKVKRSEYAASGIPEYWIVDPETETITVLTLVGNEYQVHGEYRKGTSASSVLLPGFHIDVAETFASATGE